jgi:hypothetical protein
MHFLSLFEVKALSESNFRCTYALSLYMRPWALASMMRSCPPCVAGALFSPLNCTLYFFCAYFGPFFPLPFRIFVISLSPSSGCSFFLFAVLSAAHSLYLLSGSFSHLLHTHTYLPGFSKLLGTAEGLHKTTKWVMQRGILGQFRGARDMLYGPSLSLTPAQD